MDYKRIITILISCFVIFCVKASATYTGGAALSEFSEADNVSGNEVSVTYVGNAGFLIKIGDKKILIDALFKGAAGTYEIPLDIQQKLKLAQEPFDNVDLILVTHAHGDHVDFDMVRQHMTKNTDAIFARPDN